MVEAPRPAMVPPVDNTTTTGSCWVVICALLDTRGIIIAAIQINAGTARRIVSREIEVIGISVKVVADE
jgi:hypothetical protein